MRKEFNGSILCMRIKRGRESKKLSQAQFAKKVGITSAAISLIERGYRIPSLPTLYRIASVLGVSLDYLVKRNRGDKR